METWLYTSVSVLFACGIGVFLRVVANLIFANIVLGSKYQRKLYQASELVNAAISTYMFIVGTYEKCILIGQGFVMEYYISTFFLSILYSYILYPASPDPMSLVIKYWDHLIHVLSDDDNSPENGHTPILNPNALLRNTHVDGVRRRVGDLHVPMMSSHNGLTSLPKKRKPHSSVWMFFRLSGPSLAGQFLGLHAAIQWLHFAWDGYLTTHHATKTGILRDCIICLQTGPIQGFVIEASITFFFAVLVQKISNVPLGSGRISFFLTSCIMSAIATTVLYIFIGITGAFSNPLTAYALERGCLYDVIKVVNHIIVYVFGALAGTIAFKVIPTEKHFKILAYIFSSFLLVYFLLPNVLEKNFIFF